MLRLPFTPMLMAILLLFGTPKVFVRGRSEKDACEERYRTGRYSSTGISSILSRHSRSAWDQAALQLRQSPFRKLKESGKLRKILRLMAQKSCCVSPIQRVSV